MYAEGDLMHREANVQVKVLWLIFGQTSPTDCSYAQVSKLVPLIQP